MKQVTVTLTFHSEPELAWVISLLRNAGFVRPADQLAEAAYPQPALFEQAATS